MLAPSNNRFYNAVEAGTLISFGCGHLASPMMTSYNNRLKILIRNLMALAPFFPCSLTFPPSLSQKKE